MAEVRELLAEAAAAVEEPAAVPVDAVLAAGRRRVRRRRWGTAGAGVATAAVLLAAVPLLPGTDARTTPAGGISGLVADGADPQEAACPFSLAELDRLPRRPVDPARDEFPTERAADLLALRGWPRAVPYDVTRWTVVTRGDTGLLLVDVAGRSRSYLPMTRDAGRNWAAGPPCTPR